MSTLVVYADAVDDALFNEDASSYPNARAGTGTWSSLQTFSAGTIYAGQYFADPFFGGTTVYGAFEGFESFDTSAVGSGSSVSSAVLALTADDDQSITDFDLQARAYDWGTGVTAADWVAGASLSGLTLAAHYATSGGWTVGTGYTFTDDAMPANVNKTGSTRLILVSSRTVAGTTPGGAEYVGWRPAEYAGTSSDPKLTVTYSAGGGGVTASPSAATATATGSTPSVSLPVAASPSGATATATGAVPSVTASAGLNPLPAGATATASGATPAVALSANLTLLPGGASATASGAVPSIGVPRSASPSPALVSITGGVPFAGSVYPLPAHLKASGTAPTGGVSASGVTAGRIAAASVSATGSIEGVAA